MLHPERDSNAQTYLLGGRFASTCTCPLSFACPELVCSVSGYSSMSLVSGSSGHVGARTRSCCNDPCLQNTPKLSGTVAHLGRSHLPIRWDRPLSGPVVVSHGGQPGPLGSRFTVKTRLTFDLLLRSSFCGHWLPAAFLVTAGLLVVWLQLDIPGFRFVLARDWHASTRVPVAVLRCCTP